MARFLPYVRSELVDSEQGEKEKYIIYGGNWL
jgi:hypothetical protein